MGGTFSYGLGTNPVIDYPRLLISDTQQFGADGITPVYVFADSEIMAAYQIQALTFQSSQFYSPGTNGTVPDQSLPGSPVSYLRVAALLLDALASNKARLASIKQLLDVKLDSSDAAIQLRTQANQYRDVDDNAGAFFIIEQCVNDWATRDRFWKQVQRQQAGAVNL